MWGRAGRTVPKARGRKGGRTAPSRGGGGGGYAASVTGFALDAPTAFWISDAATAQAVFELDVDPDVVATNRIVGRASLSPTVGTDGKFTSTLEQVDFEIQGGDLVDFTIDNFAFAPFANGPTYVQFWLANAALVQISPVSDTISETITGGVSGGAFYQLLFAA